VHFVGYLYIFGSDPYPANVEYMVSS